MPVNTGGRRFVGVFARRNGLASGEFSMGHSIHDSTNAGKINQERRDTKNAATTGARPGL
jgi:hypothetical protein